MKKNHYCALIAPTGLGKTKLLYDCQQALGDAFEVISLDSVQVYRGMDIGSAKPGKSEQASLFHHLIDIRDPWETYDVAQFIQDADRCIADIQSRGKVPVVVGGTLMYLHLYCQGLSEIPAISEASKSEVENIMKLPREVVWNKVLGIEPGAVNYLHAQDHQRITRILEVYTETGQSLSSWQRQSNHQGRYRGLHVVWMPEDRDQHKLQLSVRFQQMLDHGLIDEVKTLISQSTVELTTKFPSMRAIGYQQVLAYLNQAISFESMKHQAVVATRQYAKRQMTWLRHWRHPHIKVGSEKEAMQALVECLQSLHH